MTLSFERRLWLMSSLRFPEDQPRRATLIRPLDAMFRSDSCLNYLAFGASPGLTRLSLPERRSTWDRRSPVNRFSSSERVSVPDRLSLVVRLSPVRFLSSPIAGLRWLSRINEGLIGRLNHTPAI